MEEVGVFFWCVMVGDISWSRFEVEKKKKKKKKRWRGWCCFFFFFRWVQCGAGAFDDVESARRVFHLHKRERCP